MSEGHLRNAPCWCGSGKKYKNCHLNRQSQQPVQPWETAAKLRDSFSTKTCLAPKSFSSQCVNQIARAHTISKSGSLELIARAGHVYSFVPSFENLTKNNGILVPELFGINRASTFTGFCARHDDTIFAPLEKVEFCGTHEQCFLLAYRALAREAFTKSSQSSHIQFSRTLDRGRPLPEQIALQRFAAAHQAGIEAGLKDVRVHKTRYDDLLVAGNFESVRAYVIEFEGAPPVMASGSLFPEFDFDGNAVQTFKIGEDLPALVSHASVYSGTRGVVAFIWLEDSDPACVPLVRSLHALRDRDLSDAILRFLFEFCENVHIQPDWWEGLPAESRNALVQRMTMSIDPTKSRSSDCLRPDGVTTMYPKVRTRRAVGFVPLNGGLTGEWSRRAESHEARGSFAGVRPPNKKRVIRNIP